MGAISVLRFVVLSLIFVTTLATAKSPTVEEMQKIVSVSLLVRTKLKDSDSTGKDSPFDENAKFVFLKDLTNSNYLVRLEATTWVQSYITEMTLLGSELKYALLWHTVGQPKDTSFATDTKGSTVWDTLDNVYFTQIEKENSPLPPYFETKRFNLNGNWYAYVQRKNILSVRDFKVCTKAADEVKEISYKIEEKIPFKSGLERIKIKLKITNVILYLEGPYFVTEFKPSKPQQ